MKNNFPLIKAQKNSHDHENFALCKLLLFLEYAINYCLSYTVNYTINYTVSFLGYSYTASYLWTQLHGILWENNYQGTKNSHNTRNVLTTLEKFSLHQKNSHCTRKVRNVIMTFHHYFDNGLFHLLLESEIKKLVS